MAVEDIDSMEEKRARLQMKKETLGMDEPMEILRAHASSSSGA